MTSETPTPPTPAATEQPYLAFTVGGERYALPLAQVLSVQPVGSITRVPGASHVLRGIMNLRGTLLAVVDLASAFGLSVDPASANHVIVVRQADLEAGLLVGHAEEVLVVDSGIVEPRLATLPAERAEFLEGQVRSAGGLVGLLRLERVVDSLRHE